MEKIRDLRRELKNLNILQSKSHALDVPVKLSLGKYQGVLD
jgi:hypothetical protein